MMTVAALGAGCATHTAKSNHTVALCLQPQLWPAIKNSMIEFGAAHNLKFHGEVESVPAISGNGAATSIMNFALIRGLHQLSDDDFDLWLVTNPRDQRTANLNVISRRELTPSQRHTEQELLTYLKPFSCGFPASKADDHGG